MIRFSIRLLPLIALIAGVNTQGTTIGVLSPTHETVYRQVTGTQGDLKTKIAETVLGNPSPIPMLIGDQDTVLGVNPEHWDPGLEWKRANYIRVWNRHMHTLVLDSIRFRSDSITGAGSGARPMDRLFAVRTYAGTLRIMAVWGGSLKYNPITLAIGDSADFGMFEIGRIAYLVKQSATARRYRVGDTLTAPVTLYAGADSLQYILKAKVAEAYAGSAIAPMIREGLHRDPAGILSVTADGRRGMPGDSEKRILFMAPASRSAFRPR